MKPETEQTIGTLKLLLKQRPYIHLPEHEGDIYPFVWDKNTQGDFNAFNVCLSNNWFKLTDADVSITRLEGLKYAKCFNDFSLNQEQIEAWENRIELLWQVISNNLDNLEAYVLNLNSYWDKYPGIIIGQTKDKNWVAIAPTVYVETYIPQEVISRSSIAKAPVMKVSGFDSSNLETQLKKCVKDLGSISMSGDFAGDYSYSYTHQIVYSLATSKELAMEQVLQKSGMLEIGKFSGFYKDREYFDEWFCDDYVNKLNKKYNQVNQMNQFFEQKFDQAFMYRISSWEEENIYIVGESNDGDYVGLYIKSSFVCNP
ncbi:nuclease A inhibitor family protein [Anabaena cylindrica UHCC 0172]|uniref:nuclease A inhibitor family protein n=1 Tax=Anabaena cylindrica TaxID=1165 RepID=UPI002B1FE147|nr:nuclease A inhibitor family protein [Anabaena cylindrica]MEA5550062.1 nuclease A inhibitor family protein [Anabaena cylindrica UHCC 0172]